MQNSSTPNPIDSSASYNVKNPFRPNSWRRKREFRNGDGKCKLIFSHCRRFPGACFCPWGTNGCHLEHPENALWHTRCLTPMFLWCVRINNEIFLNRNKYVVFSIEIQFPEFLPPLFWNGSKSVGFPLKGNAWEILNGPSGSYHVYSAQRRCWGRWSDFLGNQWKVIFRFLFQVCGISWCWRCWWRLWVCYLK